MVSSKTCPIGGRNDHQYIRSSSLVLLNGLVLVCYGSIIVLLMWSPTPQPLPHYPRVVGTVSSHAEQRGISNVLTTTFETADTLQAIEVFYMVTVAQRGIPFLWAGRSDGGSALSFVHDRERFPFATIFTTDSRWVTSVSIVIQTIAPNRARVTIEQTESITGPPHIDRFRSLTP
jgi:hypothetical protein